MQLAEAIHWTPIYVGVVPRYRAQGSRPITIERGVGAALRVVTQDLTTSEEIVISGRTPSELEERLVVYGDFTDAQASEVIRKVMFRS